MDMMVIRENDSNYEKLDSYGFRHCYGAYYIMIYAKNRAVNGIFHRYRLAYRM